MPSKRKSIPRPQPATKKLSKKPNESIENQENRLNNDSEKINKQPSDANKETNVSQPIERE